MATRKDLETIIDVATRALNTGNDLGVFAAEDAAAAAAAAPAGYTAEALGLVDAGAGSKDPPAVKASINQNPDLAFDLTPEQVEQKKPVFIGLIETIKTTAAGL